LATFPHLNPKDIVMANTEGNPMTYSQPPSLSHDAVFKPSAPVPEGVPMVDGPEFNNYDRKNMDITAAELVANMANIGFQSAGVGKAARIINEMVCISIPRMLQSPISNSYLQKGWRDPETNAKTTIFLGYTSNLVSSGLRSVLRYLVEHKHVSAIVTTAGGIEEDLIKCLGPTYLSSFTANGARLREEGMNRIGNLVVPNANYRLFEDWVVPILDILLAEQIASRERGDEEELLWTPSTVIARLGKEINDESSILYWAYKNSIPIFCPALTDGSLGDMLHFHTFKTSPQRLIIDIVQDIRRINEFARSAKRAGVIILGGGLVKHHILNACLHRDGAESAVYINTAQEFDGSDAGARPDEAVSWGKIEAGADSVKVYCEATVVFPMIVAATFAKKKDKNPKE